MITTLHGRDLLGGVLELEIFFMGQLGINTEFWKLMIDFKDGELCYCDFEYHFYMTEYDEYKWMDEDLLVNSDKLIRTKLKMWISVTVISNKIPSGSIFMNQIRLKNLRDELSPLLCEG